MRHARTIGPTLSAGLTDSQWHENAGATPGNDDDSATPAPGPGPFALTRAMTCDLELRRSAAPSAPDEDQADGSNPTGREHARGRQPDRRRDEHEADRHLPGDEPHASARAAGPRPGDTQSAATRRRGLPHRCESKETTLAAASTSAAAIIEGTGLPSKDHQPGRDLRARIAEKRDRATRPARRPAREHGAIDRYAHEPPARGAERRPHCDVGGAAARAPAPSWPGC